MLDEADVVTLEHDSAEVLALSLGLDVVLFSVIQHQIHVFVEADDGTFDSQVDVLKDPDANSRAVLEVSEDQVDGLDHH